jgi:hypothetical protein
MAVIAHHTPVALQVSGISPENNYILSVLFKATYTIQDNGICKRAEEQLPLNIDVRTDPDNPALLADDIDVFPYKVATDVVVKGHAQSPRRQLRFEASVQIGSARKRILVIGNRRCGLSRGGHVEFSDPEPITRVALRYDHAYGGTDKVAEEKYGNPYLPLASYMAPEFDLRSCSPYAYPRNPAGVGYLVETSRAALEQIRLPNLEDPEGVLTPEGLSVGKSGAWPRMPLPQGTGWIDYGWFPRLAYFGVLPEHDTLDRPVTEVIRGLAPADLMVRSPVVQKFNHRCANGASLGLQVPYLGGSEECLLTNIYPNRSTFRFSLPGERPKIWTDGRKGKLNDTQPVLHTVLVGADESRLTLVWRGCATALRPYLPDELERMPFRVEW